MVSTLMTAKTRLDAEERLLQTVETLLDQLRRDLVAEDRVTERLRIETGIQRQERNLEAVQARIDTLRTQLGVSVSRHPVLPLRIFFSYARADSTTNQTLIKNLLTRLAPAQAEKALEVWLDEDIDPGDRWHDIIMKQIARTDAAVLMISAAFLASDYIRTHELPALLERQRLGLTTLFPVILDACDVRNASYRFPDPERGPHDCVLSAFQALPTPDHPLAGMTPSDADQTLTSVVASLRTLARKKSENASS
ncbi:MAG TPA: toll/interleukin-1 receptor domain-containing protein [Polyangiaceae bacterium]|nr:toll/interleukin-1 receptor domain-containing protein [Polyangiaceae bacterium]